MKWRKVSAEAIGCGEYIISRTRHGGRELYTLWRGQERIGFYDSADEAKRATRGKG